jgi:uncharacterized protein YrrD
MVGYHLTERDEIKGKVKDFFFDDRDWRLRYLVASLGSWGLGRRVLLPAEAFEGAHWMDRQVKVSLARNTVEESPPEGADQPRSRQHRVEVYQKVGKQPYRLAKVATSGDPHLRSFRKLKGYQVDSLVGEVGRIADLILNDDTDRICCLVVNTGGRLFGKKVLIATGQVDRIDMDNSRILVDLNRREIVTRMPYKPAAPVNHTGGGERYDYLGRRAR